MHTKSKSKHYGLLSLLLLCFNAPANTLEDALNNIQTLHIQFLQITTNEQDLSKETSQGTLWVQVPGKFHWELKSDEPQTIVADGNSLWIYDKVLEQISVFDQKSSLKNSPTAILSDPKAVKSQFDIEAITKTDSADWYRLIPYESSYIFDELQIKVKDQRIKEIQLNHYSDQTQTRLIFFYKSYNQPLPEQLFIFDIPEGVDIIQ